MSPVARCPSCGKRPEHCDCPDSDEDDKDYCDSGAG